ncbi:MAG TPA: peptidylprolyl isomerase [Acidimicrobiia bacterium]|nr:peptidylprolyl isomerase [Acidimicrobiia bacterium]
MRKSLLLLALVVACGGTGGDVAATVNGVDIAVTEVQAMRVGESTTTINKTLFATDLTDAIIDTAIVSAVRDEFGIEPSEDEIAGTVLRLEEQIQAREGVPAEQFLNAQGLPIERLQVIGRQQIIRDQLYERFTSDAEQLDGQDESTFDERVASRVTACARHILVATEEEAADAKGRIEGGETFEAVAAEVGTDGTASNGGSLGCNSLENYVTEFAAAAYSAPLGSLFGPVESEFGYHLILVEHRTAAPVRDLVTDWIFDQVTAAEIEVDPQFGTWVLEPTPMVQAPTS